MLSRLKHELDDLRWGGASVEDVVRHACRFLRDNREDFTPDEIGFYDSERALFMQWRREASNHPKSQMKNAAGSFVALYREKLETMRRAGELPESVGAMARKLVKQARHRKRRIMVRDLGLNDEEYTGYYRCVDLSRKNAVAVKQQQVDAAWESMQCSN
jgi:hypothetical protein